MEKRIIEIDIMRHKDGVFQPLVESGSDLFKARGVGHHIVVDSRQCLDIPGDRHARADQGLVALDLPVSIMQHNSNFRYGVISRITAGSFYIDYRVHSISLPT